MRIVIFAGLFACLAASAACAEGDAAKRGASGAAQTVVMHEAGGRGEKEIDERAANEGGPSSPKSFDYGTGDEALMPMGDTYDPNTGLPDKVPSDSYGQFD